MNDLFVSRTVRRGALSLAIALSITLGAFGSTAAGGKGPIEVGFRGGPPAKFQNALLNVVAVRVNPNVNAGPTAPGWQKITVPAAIGGGGSAPPEIQIDLNTSQNIVQLFNTGRIKPGSYNVAQLILDPNNPGTLVPNCPGSGILEGCINYPIKLANAGSPIQAAFPKLISVGKNSLAQLVLQLNMSVTGIPAGPGGAYTVSIDMAVVTDQVFGNVTGSIPTGPGSKAKQTRKLTVTAETIGTNTEIASAPVTPNGTGGTYTLLLPAASSFGTLYDLTLSGGKDSYVAARLLGLEPGQPIVQDFKLGPDQINQTIGNISGRITDNCTGSPITNATIQLLIPPLNNPTLSDGSGDCTNPGNAAQCVSVATANTDNAGNFPLPGTLLTPSAFASVPILKAGKTYTMTVSAPGYDTFIIPVNATSGGSRNNCSTGTSFVPCKIALSTGFITGTIPITPPVPGQTTLVQVFAEDAGTNNIVSALPMPIMVRSSSGKNPPFTIKVPTAVTPPATTRSFDLFATTIDLYQGITDPFPGHTITVMPDVTGPAPPTGPTACSTTTATASADTINCVGHGSISGSAAIANLGTSVGLAKNGVQITNTAVQNIDPNNPSSNSFAFCVPGGDTYTLERFQLPTPPLPVPPTPTTSPAASPSPTPTAPLIAPTPASVGVSIDVPVAAAPTTGGKTATPTSSPTPSPSPTSGSTPTATLTQTSTPTPTLKCPTSCSNPGGTCPGICNLAPPITLEAP